MLRVRIRPCRHYFTRHYMVRAKKDGGLLEVLINGDKRRLRRIARTCGYRVIA